MTKKLDDIALVVVRDRRFYRWLLTKGGVAVSSGREATAILAHVSAHREKIRMLGNGDVWLVVGRGSYFETADAPCA
jgi:hypothetical protein